MRTAGDAGRGLTARLGRKAIWGAVGVAAGIVLFVVLTVRWFLLPSTEVPDRADAIVVLAGGRGERLARAVELLDEPIAPVLVLSVGDREWAGSADLERLCESAGGLPEGVEVVCFAPDPDSTKGEAAAVADLAEQRGWRSLVLVTSGYHLHRAELRLGRCFDGTIHPVAAPATASAGAIAHEWLGTIEAQVLDRGCR